MTPGEPLRGVRGLSDLWREPHGAYVLLMFALERCVLTLGEFTDGGREFGLPTLARLVTMRVLVRDGALAQPGNR